MSDASKPLLDLSDLRLAPKWVADFSKPTRSESDSNSRSGSERRPFRDRDSRSGGNNFRGRDQRSGGGSRGPQGDRPSFQRDGGGNRRPDQGDRRDFDRQGGGRRQDGQGRFRDRGEFRHDHVRLLPNLQVTVAPELKATEAVANMIKSAGKAYSVFEAAKLILASGDRFVVKYQFAEDDATKLFAVPSTSSLWLSKEEAFQHLLQHESFEAYYRKEEVTLEAPKGNFASVAICGFSGLPLGPASHHSFQTAVIRVHRERFSHLSLEDYKKRIRTDNSPEAIEKWKDSVTKGSTYTYLKGEEGAEPVVLNSQADMEAHFRNTHAEVLIQEVKVASVAGNIPKNLLSPALYLHLRKAVDEARKHLLQIAQQLCSIFEQTGLKLFKRRGGKLWVSKTRPRAMDPSVTLSENIGKLVSLIKANPGIKSQDLLELISPSAEAVKAPVAEEIVTESVETSEASAAEEVVAESVETSEAPATEEVIAESVETSEAPAAEEVIAESVETSEAPATEEVIAESVETSEAPATEEVIAKAPKAVATPEPKVLNDEQIQALKDLHWLNSEGFVIEYADGVVFPGVTEPPPPKPKAPKVKTEKPAVIAEAPAPSEWDEAPADKAPAPSEWDEAPADEAASEEVAEVSSEITEEIEEASEPEVTSESEVAAEEAVSEDSASA